MVFTLTVLSVLNFSYISFVSHSVGIYAQRQQLLYDLQSARSRLLYEVGNSKKIATEYMLGNNRQVKVILHGSQAEIKVVWGDLSEKLFLRGIGSISVSQWLE